MIGEDLKADNFATKALKPVLHDRQDEESLVVMILANPQAIISAPKELILEKFLNFKTGVVMPADFDYSYPDASARLHDPVELQIKT